MSFVARQVTYLKYTLSPNFARPLNGILAVVIVVLLVTLYWTNSNHRNGANDLDFNMADYMEGNVVKQVDWTKYIKLWEPVEPEPFDIKLTHNEKCPACFGEDMCSSIKDGLLKVDRKGTPEKLLKKGIMFGLYKDERVVIKSLVSEETFQYYDEFMCKNITGDKNCDIAKAIVDSKSFVAKDTILTPSSLVGAHKAANKDPPYFEATHCSSKDLVSNLASVFDADGDGQFSPAERATFYTSFALSQEATIFRGARKKMLFGFETAQEAFHGSKFYGACGRIVVLKYGGVTVTDLLDAPWDVRVDIAVSLLGLVGQLEASDLRWYFIYGGFQLQNFVIDSEGFVGIVDAKDIGLVDLDEYPPPFPSDDDNKDGKSASQPQACNAECFANFAKELSDPNKPGKDKLCKQISIKAGQFMNSRMCQMLSDFPEHKEPNRRFRGLLHSPPEIEAADLHKALSECVKESSAGERDNAVNNLYSMLDFYLSASSAELSNEDP